MQQNDLSLAYDREQNRSEHVRARPVTSHLFQPYRHSAHCSRQFSADLWATELQDHPIGILQLNAPSTRRNGTAGSDRIISPFNGSRSVPNGCSTVSRRVRMAFGFLSSRA